MADELIDRVNKKDKIIGKVLKSAAHKDPSIIHREVAIAIFNPEGKVLLQQRSMIKVIDPGGWKISAAGHIKNGEDPFDAVKREVKEELGLDINPIFYKKEFRQRGNKESRFFWLYYAILKGTPKINFQKEEVMSTEWVAVKDLEEFSKNNKYDLKSLSHKTIVELTKKLQIS